MNAPSRPDECVPCGHWLRHHDGHGCTVIAGTVDGLGDTPCTCAVPGPFERAFRFTTDACPNIDHIGSMGYDSRRDVFVCPLCGYETTGEMGSI